MGKMTNEEYSGKLAAPMNSISNILELLNNSQTLPYIGEDISQLSHALQCGELALKAKADDEVILAALLHDIGHLCADSKSPQMGTWGVDKHELIGAQFLRSLGFSDKIAKLVASHVEAKRYLTFKHPNYLSSLSKASLQTLNYQGGPMNSKQAEDFENDSLFKAKLQIRAWDDLAKKTQWQGPNLTIYADIISKHLAS